MLFNSYSFVIFFPIVTVLYFICPKKFRYVLLCVASYYFYSKWNPKYVFLLLAVTLLTYISGLLLNKYNENLKKKELLFLQLFPA